MSLSEAIHIVQNYLEKIEKHHHSLSFQRCDEPTLEEFEAIYKLLTVCKGGF